MAAGTVVAEEQVALVTGSSRGLGRHIALGLASEGLQVVVHYHKNRQMAEETAAAIAARGKRVMTLQADVSVEKEVRDVVERITGEFGRLDILVNNAGISRDSLAWKMTQSEWDLVVETNLRGTFNCIKWSLPHMIARGYGRIVNIVSVVAQIGVRGTAAYSASKAGIVGLTKTVAREVITNGVTVNAIAPGYFKAGLLLDLKPEIQTSILEQIPMGRFGDPEELVETVKFLCGRYAGYITGQVINVNGGIYL